jgi:hypothetical protein
MTGWELHKRTAVYCMGERSDDAPSWGARIAQSSTEGAYISPDTPREIRERGWLRGP